MGHSKVINLCSLIYKDVHNILMSEKKKKESCRLCRISDIFNKVPVFNARREMETYTTRS